MNHLATLLGNVRETLVRYVAFSTTHQPIAASLWIAHTWALHASDATPYMMITSPTKRAGKTTLLELLALLVREPFHCVQPSEAVLFRELDSTQCTLLLDEVDAIFGPKARDQEGLRGILNAGHRRGAAVSRCEQHGKKFMTVRFQVYGAKAFAAIGRLPDTIEDRSIPIELQRRRRTEQPLERFRRRKVEIECIPIREALEAWATAADLCEEPDLPDELSDRQQDCWEPLLQIADAAGGLWPAAARAAALALHHEDEDEQLGVRLLGDIRDSFMPSEDHLPSSYLLERLYAIEGSPWGDFKGKGMTAHALARLLRPFKIKPQQRRNGSTKLRAYWRADFEDAWSRYLLPAPSGTSEACGTSEPVGTTG